jgi:hypothetical protein
MSGIISVIYPKVILFFKKLVRKTCNMFTAYLMYK